MKTNRSLLQNNASLASNLSSLLKNHNLTEAVLASELNLPYNTIQRLVSGETTNPHIATLQLIANYFHITVDSLMTTLPPPKWTSETKKYIPIFVPVLDWQTITTINTIHDLDLKSWREWQPLSVDVSPNAFCLPTRASMQPRFPTGTILVIDPEEKPNDNDLVLIKIKPSNELTLREIHMDPPHWLLSPILPGTEPIPYDSKQHQIMGIVVLTLFYAKQK